ncbi:MAG: AIM24 family protein [Clostridium argentinense]|uniref:AIM24 family protein n=1 Tax=Clostridium faecium TaxID=2762223 RepID=A0ABR8YT00_9CLOT|nr:MULTISPECIES: AIM24 family protein [Clostridium]MBD8047096.1 AIM24 family protein [Clostridium faecium]MBS5824565.1 AIM24 family protein [Clostridium argentinense]MDU1348380.1 AIM24 family protein [Clostridium argentinense]
MFIFETTNELCCLAKGNGQFYAKKGAMIGYKGDFRFEKSLFGPSNDRGALGALMGYVKRNVTGENIQLMTVEGNGEVYLAENAYHVTVIDLEPMDGVCVESENILAFPKEMHYDISFVGSGVISQRGLCSTQFTNKTNQILSVAVLSDGNPLILEGPCAVDPDAVVCWTGRNPSIGTQVGWKTLIGQTSGESYYLQFNEPGQKVIIQPSERLSGLKLSID